MGRVLAIDYGSKRTGIAVTDESKQFAFSLQTVPTHELNAFLKKYTAENEVEGIVVGEPKRLNNEPTHSTPLVEQFIRKLTKDFPNIPLYRVDERFTSSMAMQSIIDSGIKKKGRREKGLVDMVSATIILQSWIEQQNRF